MKTSRIIFYEEPAVDEIKLDSLIKFTFDTIGILPEKRKSIFTFGDSTTPEKIAASRIFKLSKPYETHVPTIEEIEFEMKNMSDTSVNKNIIYYDGFELQNALSRLIPHEELQENIFHVIFTNKLTCTYDHNDFRYHGRALIGSNPSIISTTGIIEAPAKPREYYLELITKSRQGVNIDTLKEKYKGTFLEYHDKRLATVVEGYFLQALIYYETGEPFCADKECRLFNAHWQKDLLHSQLDIGKLCQRHQNVLENMTT